MSKTHFGNRERRPGRGLERVVWTSLIGCSVVAGMLPLRLAAGASDADAAQHMVVSEIVTGGAAAGDELIELFNPTAQSVALAGLEVVYVSASGTTVTRRVTWSTDATAVPAGGHVLLANEDGVYADLADFLYSGGIAAGGGSIALRAEGAGTAIDAVGWGSAVAWLEGVAAPAPAPGSSIERLPGGESGSWQDTDDTAHDFVERPAPDPRGLSSRPIAVQSSPSPDASPTDSATPSQSGPATPSSSAVPSPSGSATPPHSATPPPSGSATPSVSMVPAPTAPASGPQSTAPPSDVAPSPVAATPSAAPSPLPIDVARSQASGTVVTVEGVALTAHDFGDGGGYIADSSGGIAVLVEEGVSFPAGARVRVTGPISDRFSQRTLRPEAAGVVPLGPGVAPTPAERATGSIGEDVEGRLVRLDATVQGAPTLLSAGSAFEVDDGTGPVRVLVGTAAGIDTGAWQRGVRLAVIGVVGQRDSSGTGTQGYRVQPRDAFDIVAVVPAATPSLTPTPPPATPPATADDGSGTDGGSGAHDGSGTGDAVAIGLARLAPVGARLTVRGVVTMPPGVIDPDVAFIQDATAGIMLRLADATPALRVGQLIVADGVRSTKAGMATVRLTDAPLVIGEQPPPAPHRLRTGGASEAVEGSLVVAIGTLDRSARRASSGTVSFDVDDGSGPLRVVLPAALGADDGALVAAARIEVFGVLGQETTGSAPHEGYRVWPASSAAVRVIAAPPSDAGLDAPPGAGTSGSGSSAAYAFGAVAPDAADDPLDGGAAALDGIVVSGDVTALRVGATIVALDWPELGVGGLLWDGHRLVAVSIASAGALHDGIGRRAIPVAAVLTGLAPDGVVQDPQLPVVALTRGADGVSIGGAAAAPRAALPDPGDPVAWVALTGRLSAESDGLVLEHGGERVRIERRCANPQAVVTGIVTVTGIGTPDARRIVVPCDGLRPAPVLRGDKAYDSTAARSAASGRRDAPTTTSATDSPPGGADDSRRGVAGALLVTGMTGLLAGVVAARRFSQPGRGAEDSAAADDFDGRFEVGASGAAAEDGEAGDGGGDSRVAGPVASGRPSAVGEVPNLTLLRLPRNRGSP